jgi:hypothetical protein
LELHFLLGASAVKAGTKIVDGNTPVRFDMRMAAKTVVKTTPARRRAFIAA